MKTRLSPRALIFVLIALYAAELRAQDYTWWSGDDLIKISATPTYAGQAPFGVLSASVVVYDYTVGKSKSPPNDEPYVYPPVVFPFAYPDVNSPQQIVAQVPDQATVNGTMEFRQLSSPDFTYLYVDLSYGVDTVQTRRVNGSILEVPQVKPPASK
jgi:hypothetical protein